jgi:hypothetical protein
METFTYYGSVFFFVPAGENLSNTLTSMIIPTETDTKSLAPFSVSTLRKSHIIVKDKQVQMGNRLVSDSTVNTIVRVKEKEFHLDHSSASETSINGPRLTISDMTS